MGRRSKIVGTLFGMILMLGLIVAPATADPSTCKDHGDFSQNLVGDSDGDWGSIEFTPDDGPLVLTVEEGWQVELCIKKSTDPQTVGPFGEGTYEVDYPGFAPADGFSHYDFIASVVEEDELELTLVKDWDGEDEGDASETFFTGEGEERTEYLGPFTVGNGDEVVISEEVEGLPDDCFYTADRDMPYEYTVDAEDAVDGVITLTITNTVECDTDEFLGGGEIQTGGETTTTTTEETVEVLGEEEVRPSGVPAGTGGHLPATGAQGLLLLLLTGLGLTLGGITLRRMSAE